MNERIRDVRLALGLSQDEFAKRLGFTRGVITNIELKRAEIKPRLISLICQVYNVNEYWLETGNGSMFREVSDIDKAVAFYMSALAGGNAELDTFKQVFVKELAALLETFGADGWAALQTMIRNTYEAQKEKGQD